ncbi:YbdD/YjiX family protein [Microbacterium lushaniae]|nr:YbdD/YjiX family protein [Microbacterium lushaniae]KAA9155458.1 YbdD/YjiX family protein [Microbacterium lushaniae]
MTASDAPAPSAWWVRVREPLARTGRSIRWYVTTLMGDRAYDTYVAHLRVHHPAQQPMTEREFWRDRLDRQDRNPGARCC